MLLTIPAVISCVVTVLALFVGAGAMALSTGPGFRPLRWFGFAAICASVYGVCAGVTTLELSADVRPFFGRLGGASASLLVGSWIVYFAARRGRGLARWERVMIGAIIVVAIAWLVPGLCRTSEIFMRTVPWLGVSYATTRPTALGQLTYLFLMVCTCVLDARVFLAWRRGQQGALADFLGVSVQLVAGVNDALAASGRIDTPYALDVGQFVVVLAVGTTLISRFVADARALERSSADLRAAQTELVRRERLAALGELSAVVAHEVRNPLTVIFNALASLRKQPVAGDAATLLDIVGEEAERLKRVVGELLEFARPREVSMNTVHPARLVESAVEAAVAGFGAASELVDVETDAAPPKLSGDEHLLRQALVNMITNGLQAAGRKGHVRVRVSAPEGASTIAFSVYDDGAGIPDDVAERMFTPFFTTRASGTGLGLAIVKRIAESHGGTITWRPGPEGAENAAAGVTFTLQIPLHR